MFIIRLASDALSSITEGEQTHQMHQTDNSPSTSQYESLKKIEEIPKQPSDDTQKRLLSIKRVHRLIEEELMMEYDMKATNKLERHNNNNSNNNNNVKLSRYHEKDEFCTPYSSSNQRSKNETSVKRNTTERSISTPKKCSPPTSLLYDLLSGRENFNSVYMRSQLVFVTCDDDNVESINNFAKEDFHSKRKTRGQTMQRRRKPLRPTKHCIALRTPEKSTDTDGGKHFPRNAASAEKLSSSPSSFSLSPSSTSSPSSSSSLSSSVLSPSNINMLTCSQVSPKKLLDKIDFLNANNTIHSQSSSDHSSLLSIINNQECLEQPLDLSSASHSNRLGLPNSQSDMTELKRRRSFAGKSRLSDNSDVIKCSAQRHNSVNLPLSTKKIGCNRKTSANINTTILLRLRLPSTAAVAVIQDPNVNQHTEKLPVNISNTESNALTTNFLDFILSPDCYRVALNNSNNNNDNNLLNSRNTPKTTYELAYELLNSLSNSGGTTSSVKQENEQQQHQQQQQCLTNTSPTSADNSSYPSVVNTQDCQQNVVSPKSTSKIPLCKSNSMSKYNTGDNFPPKKSLSNRLYSIKKVNQADYLNKTHSLPNRTLNQHSSSDNNSSNSNSNNNNNFDTDIVDIITTRHSFTSSCSSSPSSSSSPSNSSPMKVPSEDFKLFLRRNSSRYRGRIRYWLIQMISLVKQPEPILISLLQNNESNNNNNNSNDKMTQTSNIPVEQMTSLLSCFRLHILDQSIETRLKFLNMSWYRLLLVYLIEHKQLDLLTIESVLPSSSASTSSADGSEGNDDHDDDKSTHGKYEQKDLINNNEEIKSKHKSADHTSSS
ncbi:unnamed protein product [Trichobilharzia szidati]|nr:unnamed protein product [Trichobilharzia szidati]